MKTWHYLDFNGDSIESEYRYDVPGETVIRTIGDRRMAFRKVYETDFAVGLQLMASTLGGDSNG